MSLRVAVDGRELRAGVRTGIRRYTLEVLRAAAARGLECIAYVDRRAGLEALPAGVRRSTLGGFTQWWDQVALPSALRRDRVDVFLSPYYKRPLSAPCPAVVTIHDLFFIGYPGRRRPLYDAVMTRLARLYAAGASAIIADSEHSRRAIVDRLGIAAGRTVVIPVGLGPEFQPTAPTAVQRERYGLGPRYALYVGNFLPHKNLPRLLGAWAALPEALRSSHRLVLAGGDRTGRPALAAAADSLGLRERVVFPGLIDDADLPALYGGADAVVQPSLEEGFGLPALEAMSCGAPVVASDAGAHREILGSAGLLLSPDDPQAWRETTQRLFRDEPLRRQLIETGRERSARYTWDDCAQQTLEVYRRGLGRTG